MLQSMTNALAVPSGNSRPISDRLQWASGVLALFQATGGGFFLSGLCAWIAEGIGLRGKVLIAIANGSLYLGFVAAVGIFIGWFAARCRRGDVYLSRRFILLGLLALPAGAISWAIFVDAIAWHLRRDIVRPAVDMAMMYLVLATVMPMAVGIPFVLSRVRRRFGARSDAE
jgi:hypothetical protein